MSDDRIPQSTTIADLHDRRLSHLSNLPFQDNQIDISAVDWSNLPEDILELIFKCLNDPLDLHNSRGVCQSWYSVGRYFSRQHLQSLPPLILFIENRRMNDENSSSNNNSTSEREMVFYNYHSRKFCRFPIPFDLHGSWLSGSSHGWIISTQRNEPYEICLLNAVSRAQIRLSKSDIIKYTPKLRLIMSGNPSFDLNCSFLVISPCRDFMFYRLRDRRWRKISTKSMLRYGASTFYEGHFYVYVRSGVLLMIEARTSQVTKIQTKIEGSPQERQYVRVIEALIDDKGRDDYLMESTGDLLRIKKCIGNSGITEVQVYKLDKMRKVWLTVEDLGNRALFVGYNNSITVLGGIEGTGLCRANCIYFLDDSYCVRENQVSSGGACRGMYDMETRVFKEWITGLRPIWFNAPLSWIRPEVQRLF